VLSVLFIHGLWVELINYDTIFVIFRQGASFVEQWNDGYAFSEINKY